MRELASGLEFPEAPVALDDGSVLVVEIKAGTLTRIGPDGEIDRVATCAGGPNGAALGPGGKVFLCNNGGLAWHESGGLTRSAPTPGELDIGGRIQVADLETGKVEDLYVECDGRPLSGPNDIVMDDRGGFYFTDFGKNRGRTLERGGVYYAKCDGSAITELAFPLQGPNGIGLSPDGGRLLVAETFTARILAWEITRPGALGDVTLMGTVPGLVQLDSLAVERDGNVAVATVPAPLVTRSAITVLGLDGTVVEHVEMPVDGVVTNICFGGPSMRTAYITASGVGALFQTEWARPGLPLIAQELTLP